MRITYGKKIKLKDMVSDLKKCRCSEIVRIVPMTHCIVVDFNTN